MKCETYYQEFLSHYTYPRSLKSLAYQPGFSNLYLQSQQQKFINFSSSDYLGLAQHPLLIQRAQEYAAQFGVGSSASRLVTGNFAFYENLENKLAHALKKPAALILGSGYQTNFSVIEALLDPAVLTTDPLIFCDKLCHASIYSILQKQKYVYRFRHNELTHLRLLLEKHAHATQPKFIFAESLYSMDGDVADLSALTQLARDHQAFLYVDDAHAVGVYGAEGWGRASEYAEDISLVMGTFSKALGSFGGYVGCSTIVRDFLINKCRGLIYSTGLSPAILGAISAAIELVPQLICEREKLWQTAAHVRQVFQTKNIPIGESTTHIIPWIIGDAHKTRQASALLEAHGILGVPILPPSVAVGKSRIRFCLSAAHTEQDIVCLLEAVDVVAAKL